MKSIKYVAPIWMLIFSYTVNAQIVVDLLTLPEPGESLEYNLVTSYNEDTHTQSGADIYWDFSTIQSDGTETEYYAPSSEGNFSEDFPDADIVIDFFGNEGYANKNTTSISIIGIAGEGFNGFDIPVSLDLDQPFIIKRAPIGYEDSYGTSTYFEISLDIDSIPGLGMIIDSSGVIPAGTTVDSIRMSWDLNRTEEADSWGTVNVRNQEMDVLRIIQEDETTIGIEMYVVSAFGGLWLDVSAFLPEGFVPGGTTETTTYKFLSMDSKESIVEIISTSDMDGNETLTGRFKASLTSDNTNVITENNFSIIPNPVLESFRIEMNSEIENATISIYNMNGQRVLTKKNVSIDSEILVGHLASGQYSLKVTSGSTVSTSKLVILK